jgi:hypothetical protein
MNYGIKSLFLFKLIPGVVAHFPLYYTQTF